MQLRYCQGTVCFFSLAHTQHNKFIFNRTNLALLLIGFVIRINLTIIKHKCKNIV